MCEEWNGRFRDIFLCSSMTLNILCLLRDGVLQFLQAFQTLLQHNHVEGPAVGTTSSVEEEGTYIK